MYIPDEVRSKLKELAKLAENAGGPICVEGVTSGAAKALVCSRLAQMHGGPILIIVESNAELDRWQSDLRFFFSECEVGDIVNVPSLETDIYSGASPHAETQELRAIALASLLNRPPKVVLTTLRGVASRMISPEMFSRVCLDLRLGTEISPAKLAELLAASGFAREDPVFGVGQFSWRGGIFDVWPAGSDSPLRIEFFGDLVESIRKFDPETQLSIERISSAEIHPMREFPAFSDSFRALGAAIESRFTDENFSRSVADHLEFTESDEAFPGWEFFYPLVGRFDSSIFDYFSPKLIVVDEPAMAENDLLNHLETAQKRYSELVEAGIVALPHPEYFLSIAELRSQFEDIPRVEFRALGTSAAETDEDFSVSESSGGHLRPLFLFPSKAIKKSLEFIGRPAAGFSGDLKRFTESLSGKDTLIVARSGGIRDRIAEILAEYGVSRNRIELSVGNLSSGFELPQANFTVLVEENIFVDRSTYQSRQGLKSERAKQRVKIGAFISDFRDLKEGDYVVHIDHGIGRFAGLKTIVSDGVSREFLHLVYADQATLFVPVERMDLVSRYASAENAKPTLDKLGGIGWQKTKARAKRQMRDMADELLRLFAERQLVEGYAFSSDAPWQREFEDAFPFELTRDQATAIDDVKRDMESRRPMDRLIVGDVGYGKTEVAMRAAFKAAMDSRQVAVLAPTTILAYQHYESFKKRFAAFPIRIDLLSRFRSRKEQAEVVRAAEAGEIDVLIGTHRILSNDVSLPRLGLLIIDEEQRFGVAHKEKLKRLRKKIDVLTLSATPIPRTLNMSLAGIRDMSVIETPPRDRMAINTQVVQFSESVIRSAIELEMERSGQVFFIHNRVETIETVAALVKNIVPNARIAIGHGKMNEKEMEQIMLDFMDYEYDVLVATTIIENGIDIPLANTIIINRADTYGLSQLYQLRGRVGRSNRRAYAYLLIPSELELTPIARRRLSAIREFSDLGAGFRIAALDLELRGAGAILGGEQSGHIDAVGFDLYSRMLNQTIAELRGEEISDESSVTINMGIDVSIPANYISDTGQRLRTYKRITSAETTEILGAIREEIKDRYGNLPDSVENLFAYAKLRRLADRISVISVESDTKTIAIKFRPEARVDPEKLAAFIAASDSATFSPNGILRFRIVKKNPIVAAIDALKAISREAL
ncbi:MAG: transcription-repair coupling factor [Blastocatellia bacterium]